jgi:predicted Rossmann-fold nucleotide-binding protein
MSSYVLRDSLYTSEDLLAGFDAEDPIGFVKTYDFQMFQRFVVDGGAAPSTPEIRLRQADHDAHIAHALAEHLRNRPRLVGVMGGHKVRRDEESYRQVALLCKRLTGDGFLVASGGGPGAMEAAHVGAACANYEVGFLDEVLALLGTQPKLPNIIGIVEPDGSINPERLEDVKAAHQWMLVAVRALNMFSTGVSPSLAIPTWLYGQEPSMPFATAYAKYFQNSIREEALVTEARAGIIYARGGGGTLREIFQDVEQNFYAPDAAAFTPMVFFDPEDYWRREAEIDLPGKAVLRPGIKIDETISKVFRFARAKVGDTDACLDKIRFTVDFEEIASVLSAHAPVATERLSRMLTAQLVEADA